MLHCQVKLNFSRGAVTEWSGEDILAGTNMQIVKSSEASKEKTSEKRDVGYKKGANLDVSHGLFMEPVFH